MRGKQGMVFQNNYKGFMDKTKQVGIRGGRCGWLVWGGSVGG